MFVFFDGKDGANAKCQRNVEHCEIFHCQHIMRKTGALVQH